jgi:hypothetical protein
VTEKSRRVVSRTVAVAVSAIAVVFLVSLVGVVVYCEQSIGGKDSQISNLTAQNQAQSLEISFLNSQISTLQNQTASDADQVASLTAQVTQIQTWLNGNITLLNSLNRSSSETNTTLLNELSALANVGIGLNITSGILTLSSNATTLQSTAWINGQTVNNAADSYTNLGTFTTSNVGYVVLNCTSNKPRTYARFIYSANGVNFDSGEITVGQNGTAIFPVLPAEVQVIVGNHAANAGSAGVTETVTVTYIH